MTNEIQIIKEVVEVYPNWFEIMTGIIVPLGSLAGVIFTVWISNRNNQANLKIQQDSFAQAIKRSQKEFALSKLEKAVDIATNYMMDKYFISNSDKEELRKDMILLKRTISQYGSNETVEFFSNLNQIRFELETKGDYAGSSFTLPVYYSYLLSFLRFDISGEWIDPTAFFKISSKEYNEFPENYDATIRVVYEDNKEIISKIKNR